MTIEGSVALVTGADRGLKPPSRSRGISRDVRAALSADLEIRYPSLRR